jgi:preprotein translocase subunit YajC
VSALPLIIILLLLVVAISLSRRTKRRAAAGRAGEAEKIRAGTEVMTTSGLYATVITLDGEGTAVLSIAPGVDVKWAVAALKPVEELPDTLRPGPSLQKHPEPHTENDPTDTT